MVDARGYLCPMPVLMVQKEVKKTSPSTLEILVDDECAKGNVTRFGQSQGYMVEVEDTDDGYKLTFTK